MTTSITGRTDDQQVLLINMKDQQAIVMGIKDLDNAAFIVVQYLKAATMSMGRSKTIDILTYSQYSVDQQEGYIIKFKMT